MTPEQIKMARHALGLEDGRKVSYRNRYFAGGPPTEAAWNDLVAKGLAERTSLCFHLTEVGAKAVLLAGERLDPEDFPS